MLCFKCNHKLFTRLLSHAATMLYEGNVRILIGFISLISLEFRVTQCPKGSRKRVKFMRVQHIQHLPLGIANGNVCKQCCGNIYIFKMSQSKYDQNVSIKNVTAQTVCILQQHNSLLFRQ